MGETWTKYVVKGKFIDKVYGGLPGDPEIIEGFLASKKELMKAEKKPMKEMIEKSQELETTQGQLSKVSNIFARDEKGVFFFNYQFAAGLKEAMSIQKSITMWRSKMQRGMRVLPSKIYLSKNGKPIKEPDGFEQNICHSTDNFGGDVSSLKRVEYLIEPEFEFEVWVGNDKEGPIISKKHLQKMLEHCEITGFGAKRTMGGGMNKTELVEPKE